jgi:4-hydroxy-3-methylbut-2-enyl diphosphate reductase
MRESVEIKIDENAGFCFGVVAAIHRAEQELVKTNKLYCLGDIVHNNEEVERLSQKGLAVITYSDFEKLSDAKVFIRAHGEPPSTYKMAQERNIELIDATCPIVLHLQQRIRKGYEEMKNTDGQVVIFGKKGHAEVIGLQGQTENSAIVISSIGEIDSIDVKRPIRLYSQTTKSKETYQELIELLKQRCEDVGNIDFIAHNTICNRVSNRAKELVDFANSVDIVVFVSGTNSSNGKYLYDYCKKVKSNTLFVSTESELTVDMFDGIKRIGITGATSTPMWLMKKVEAWLQKNL